MFNKSLLKPSVLKAYAHYQGHTLKRSFFFFVVKYKDEQAKLGLTYQ